MIGLGPKKSFVAGIPEQFALNSKLFFRHTTVALRQP
jgi:hypothetical protein